MQGQPPRIRTDHSENAQNLLGSSRCRNATPLMGLASSIAQRHQNEKAYPNLLRKNEVTDLAFWASGDAGYPFLDMNRRELMKRWDIDTVIVDKTQLQRCPDHGSPGRLGVLPRVEIANFSVFILRDAKPPRQT